MLYQKYDKLPYKIHVYFTISARNLRYIVIVILPRHASVQFARSSGVAAISIFKTQSPFDS